jgi:RNA polymerase sigma factor (sigma-70 family)
MSLALSVTQLAPTCSEHDLVAAVRRGDDRAFEELYSRYRRRVGAYVYGMVADHGRAEDITQDVFISALRRMRDSERPIAFRPWIYEIAKNACIDDFRRARRAREVPIGGDDELEHENPRLVAKAVTPEAAVESRQQLTDLRGAFRGLSESHHKIIVLRELEGLSYTQIGEQMGMSRPVVESTLFRARRRLGEEYDELVSGRRCDHVQTVIGERGPRTLRSLGVKERRLVARHLAHCHPCRRHAHLAGFDESRLQTPVVGKIAALLPIPAFLRLRLGGGAADAGAGASKTGAARTHAFNALQSAQSVANAVDPTGPFAGMSRVAAGAAALVIAGAGGGIVTGLASSSSPHRTAGVAGATGAGARDAGSRLASAISLASNGGSRATAAAVGQAAAAAAPLPASSTSGAGLRIGAAAPRSPGRLPPIKRPAAPVASSASPTATSASVPSSTGGGSSIDTTAGSALTGVTSSVTSGVAGVTSGVAGVTSSVTGVTSGVTSGVTGVTSGVSKLVPANLPPIQLPGITVPSTNGGSTNPQSQALPQGVTISVPDPAAVVAPLLNKLGLG